MVSSKGPMAAVAALAVIGIVLGATSFITNRTSAAANEPPRDRLIWIEAVEYKGSTETAKLAPPQNLASNPKALGDAFGFKWVEEPQKKWEVSAYAFTPSTIIINQGDKVTLRFFGVNGDVHKMYIEKYAQNAVELNRGRTLDISFVADKPGLFQIVCSSHEPAMRGWLVVQPRA